MTRAAMFGGKEPESGFIFEVTARCNNDCLYCYNVWKRDGGRAPPDMPASSWYSIVEKLRRESSVKLVTVSGGEPFLRGDLPGIVDYIHSRRIGVNLIANGTMLTERNVAATVGGVTLYEVPMLSDKATVHDGLARNRAFDKVIEGMANVTASGGKFAAVFVATALNAGDLAGACEMAIALGASSLMYNPFNPGGEGLRHLNELAIPATTVKSHLDTLEHLSGQYGVPVHCGVPILPCVLDTSQYRRITFSFCPAGQPGAYYTIDPAGMLRMCNHSPSVLGDYKAQTLRSLKASKAAKRFSGTVPEKCMACGMKERCRGGCNAAAEQLYGTLEVNEPVQGIKV